jgi:mannose-6-phosphate isomerase-like protein (cupin superfamily)
MIKVSRGKGAQQYGIPGMFDEAETEAGTYSVAVMHYDIDIDFADFYKGLPNDECQSSHLGYVVKGKGTFRLTDGTEEVLEAGDAFVIEPGHNLSIVAGTEFVVFTPIAEAKAQEPVVMANTMKWAAEHGIELPG